MKRLSITALCFAFLCGCTFLQQHQPALVAISRIAAQQGATLWLQQHPGDKPYFTAAAGALTSLIDSKNFDPVEFQRALASLPINELNGSSGSIYISVGIVVWDEVAQASQAVNDQKTTAAIITSVRDGIRSALAATP